MEQKDYAVTIRASITKTIHVKADSLDNAEWEAHDTFRTAADDLLIGPIQPEAYEQDTVSTKWADWSE